MQKQNNTLMYFFILLLVYYQIRYFPMSESDNLWSPKFEIFSQNQYSLVGHMVFSPHITSQANIRHFRLIPLHTFQTADKIAFSTMPADVT